MMAANPYERRRGPRHPGQAMSGDAMMPLIGGLPHYGRSGSPIVFEDLEALVANAVRRGAAQREGQHFDEMQNGRREAWQVGYDVGENVGETDGRRALLKTIDERVGSEVRTAINANRELLTKLDADQRKVTKAELAERVRGLGALLEGLVGEHHRGFADDPF